MKSRSLSFTCAVLLTAITMSTTAHADVGQQMESLAVAIEAGGDPQSAADLRSAVAQVPPETLDRIYANIDLMPLAAAFAELSISKQKSAEALKQLPAPLQDFQRQNLSLSSNKKCDRENDYYGCFPKSTGTICTAWSDTSANPMRRVSPNLLVNAAVTVATLQGTTSIAAKAANIAKI